jgi:hypothetical protein
MDLDSSQTYTRTGAKAPKDSGLHTIAFFALITVVVGAAGLLGVAMWGPEKPIKNRSHLASAPPPPTLLPSLTTDAPSAVPPVAETAPPADSSSASSSPSAKKGKKTQRTVGKKH